MQYEFICSLQMHIIKHFQMTEYALIRLQKYAAHIDDHHNKNIYRNAFNIFYNRVLYSFFIYVSNIFVNKNIEILKAISVIGKFK